MGTIGARIENPMDLFKHKSVYVKSWGRPCAVSFLISMQFRSLSFFIQSGIFEYAPAKKSTKTFIDQVKSQPCQKQ